MPILLYRLESKANPDFTLSPGGRVASHLVAGSKEILSSISSHLRINIAPHMPFFLEHSSLLVGQGSSRFWNSNWLLFSLDNLPCILPDISILEAAWES